MPRLTESQTKYLYVVYKAQKDDANIRSVDIARELGVTKASVSRMIKLLAELGLISIQERGSVTLTPKGNYEGAQIHDKVMRIYPFFFDYLGLDKPEAISSTYSFLCGFSDNCIDRLLGKGWILSGLSL